MELNSRSRASIERYGKAKAMVDAGMAQGEAIKKAKISSLTWYKYQKQGVPSGGTEPKRKSTKKAKPKFIDLSPPGTPGPAQLVSVVVCSLDNLQAVLGRLK